MKDKLETIRQALEYYGNGDNYYTKPMNRPEPVVLEMGKRATEALTLLDEITKELESESVLLFKFHGEWCEVRGTKEDIECMKMYMKKQP